MKKKNGKPYTISIEFILELLLPLLSPPLDRLTPARVGPVPLAQPPIDLVNNFPKQLRVLALLDLVVGHPQRLQLHRDVVVAVVGDEHEAPDLGPAGVEGGVGLHVELLAVDDDWSVRLLGIDVAAVGVDLVDHLCRNFVVAVHGGEMTR